MRKRRYLPSPPATKPTEKKAKKTTKKRLTMEVPLTAKQKRAMITRPGRHELTQNEWEEWGDNLRVLRNIGFKNASRLSLQESREVMISVNTCGCYRAKYYQPSA